MFFIEETLAVASYTYIWSSTFFLRREPESLVKPPKNDSNKDCLSRETIFTDDEKKPKSKAMRYIIMVRHGQYNMEGVKSEDRCLTPLGR